MSTDSLSFLWSDIFPKFSVIFWCYLCGVLRIDTVLNEIDFIPNLLFLDSWDLNLYNPFPSAVHTLREFLAMEDKMLVGSIIIIDDNYFSNFHNPTWVDCHNADESIERITLPYPVIGKGSNIYAWVDTAIDCPWKFLSSNPDIPGACNVIVIQKQ